MAFIDSIGSAVVEPLTKLFWEFINLTPRILSATIVILFGYLLGWLLGNSVKHLLKKMKFDEKFMQLHLAKPLEKIKISKLLGWIVKWYTFVIFAAAGAGYVNLYPVTGIMEQFAQWFPNLMIAMGIGIGGAVLAEYIHKMILHVNIKEIKVLANLTKYFVLAIVVVMALDQIIDISVLERVMLILVGGFAVGISLAIGIAFGLALKDEATGWIGAFKKK